MMTTSRDHGLTSEELRMLEGILTKLSGQGADLPPPLFRFMTEITATANVDLLVQDDEKGVLLAWRDDPFGTGWHVPGSIIRHREEITHRILACAGEEFGCEIDVADRPVALIQIFDDRGHSISLCYPSVLRGRPCCTDRVCGRGYPSPARRSGDADGVRASEPQHTVERMDGDVHLGRPTLVAARA